MARDDTAGAGKGHGNNKKILPLIPISRSPGTTAPGRESGLEAAGCAPGAGLALALAKLETSSCQRHDLDFAVFTAFGLVFALEALLTNLAYHAHDVGAVVDRFGKGRVTALEQLQ